MRWIPDTMMHPPSADTCIPVHDSTTFTLSALISAGLLLSYLPQHARIIYYKTSEGIDPTFLLLGTTSSASSLLNIIALSWTAVRCCPFLVSLFVSIALTAVLHVHLRLFPWAWKSDKELLPREPYGSLTDTAAMGMLQLGVSALSAYSS